MILKLLSNITSNKQKTQQTQSYSHEQVLEKLLGKTIIVDIGGVPDGTVYALGLILPHKKNGFAIYNRWENSDYISISCPYQENSGLKKTSFGKSFDFEPNSSTSKTVKKQIITANNFWEESHVETNPEYETLDKLLNEYGLTEQLHKQKLKELNSNNYYYY